MRISCGVSLPEIAVGRTSGARSNRRRRVAPFGLLFAMGAGGDRAGCPMASSGGLPAGPKGFISMGSMSTLPPLSAYPAERAEASRPTTFEQLALLPEERID